MNLLKQPKLLLSYNMKPSTKTMLRNILIAPVVLLIRVPVMINYSISKCFVDLVDKYEHAIPGFEAVKK